MKKLSILTILLLATSLYADGNVSKTDNNNSNLTQKQIEEQMKLEEKFAKEQKFYQGSEYDLKSKEINQKSLDNIPAIEPDYDFDITDVYRDDI
jgi:predicted esterase YcpF (UPF0227 family)